MSATRAVFFVAAAAFAAQLLFPPWVRTYQRNGISQVRSPSTYVFVGRPPESGRIDTGYEIDGMRLALQLAATAAVTGLALAVTVALGRAAPPTPSRGFTSPYSGRLGSSDGESAATATEPTVEPRFVQLAHTAAIALYLPLSARFPKVRDFHPEVFDLFMTCATVCRAIRDQQRTAPRGDSAKVLAKASDGLRELFGEKGPIALIDCGRFARERLKAIPSGVAREQAVPIVFGMWVLWNLLDEQPGEEDDGLVAAVGFFTGAIDAET